jgi:FtsP/CotA-like multicopper oxidase with cupredoxin domain
MRPTRAAARPGASGATRPHDEWRPGRALRILAAAFGSAGLTAAALAAAAHLSGGGAAPAAQAAARPAAPREFTLTAREVDWELFPGTTVRAWAYNGTVPGPEIRVAEGDLVRVTLKNDLPVPTAVHWHGLDVPNPMDGVPGLTQAAVPPGGTFTYEFTASNVGTRWYHSHQDAELQGPLGLYGPLIVEPRTPEPARYDREYTYTLSEWDLDLTPAVATGEASLPRSGAGVPLSKQLDYDLFLLNGHAHESIPPIAVAQGERVRLRLINAGNLLHTMHSHGHSFRIVATDGNPVPPGLALTKDSVTLGPSERVDVELHTTNPGVWMFHCHMEHHMANGMMTTLRYEGAQPPAAAAAGGGHDGHHGPPAAAPAAPAGAAPAGAGATFLRAAPDVPGTAARLLMVDNRFQPSGLTVPAGTTVAWVNTGANVHTVSSFDGSFESGAIAPDQAFTYTFSQPGQYQYLCRQHLLNGMSGTIVVQ